MPPETIPEPRRPLVWLNCAVSADGRLAFAGGARARLSGPEDLARVQRLRADSDGVVIGVGTVIADDPSLRVHWEALGGTPGTAPTRVVLDSRGRTPEKARVLDGSLPTIVATTRHCLRSFPASVTVIAAGEQRVDLAELFPALGKLGFRRLLVEGGGEVLGSILRARLFDRMTVYVAPGVIGAGDSPAMVAGPAAESFQQATSLELLGVERLGAGYVASYAPRTSPERPAA